MRTFPKINELKLLSRRTGGDGNRNPIPVWAINARTSRGYEKFP